MPKWLRILLAIAVVLAVVVAIGGYAVWRGVQYVPEFYQQAVDVEPTHQQADCDAVLKKATALASDLKRSRPWQATFSESEINGWLAVDLVKNYAGCLPASIRDPRVTIAPDRVTVACRYREGRINTVLWLSLDVYLEAPNVVALRVRKARAGALPLPLDDVLKQIGQATGRLHWRIEWQQADGDPVAVVTIPPHGKDQKAVELTEIRLDQGEIHLAGTAQPLPSDPSK